jgi:hypothetical protein
MSSAEVLDGSAHSKQVVKIAQPLDRGQFAAGGADRARVAQIYDTGADREFDR